MFEVCRLYLVEVGSSGRVKRNNTDCFVQETMRVVFFKADRTEIVLPRYFELAKLVKLAPNTLFVSNFEKGTKIIKKVMLGLLFLLVSAVSRSKDTDSLLSRGNEYARHILK